MNMFHYLEELLLGLADVMPVEMFAFVGAFVEEIIAPIPSPLIMMMAGVFIEGQGKGIYSLLWIAFFAAISKTFASWILYTIVDKLEDIIFGKWGKFFGIEHEFIENIGQKFNKGIRDYFTVFMLRAIPIIPSAPISVLSGFFKIDLKAYLVGTFLGTVVRNIIYLMIGFSGLHFVERYNEGLLSLENYTEIFIVTLVVCLILWGKWIYNRKPK